MEEGRENMHSELLEKEREENRKQGASKWQVGLHQKKTNKIYKGEGDVFSTSIFGIHASCGVGIACILVIHLGAFIKF